jgi:formylglycine-generating enzyme required for sulfatase activity
MTLPLPHLSPLVRRTFLFGLALFVLLVLSPASAIAQQTQPLKPGNVFRDCKDCPELVVIPKGLYLMGSNGRYKAAKPAHRVSVKKVFAIGRYEVTFKEWLACVDGGGCLHKPDDHKWGRTGRPVINITWDQAKNYLRWMSKKTGKKYRLPTESEWEYVHRAGTTTRFWWGDKVGENLANCKDCKSKWSAKSTAPVGSFKANPFGVYDTSGNVFEWVEDCWNDNHFDAPKTTAARRDGNCHFRVIRGGSFYYFNKVARSFYRAKNPPAVKSYWLGFRVLREIP